eukprot:CAMPEP_0117432474 /NCGR_PEP_ID=MMETSP0758-20121206/11956_1 /TAXON_ID=63605 /ORGANISM="Percolomonas cosmopolitus, Strain AE-1 (ATCC 50343)" /LENGTH=371 /DNA_ID=CAMNT_0005222415 /DNA_START=292 /DNA_END=1405 /DNA_ORIENTATION=-
MKCMNDESITNEEINTLYEETLEAMTTMLFSKKNPQKKREENIEAMKHWLNHFQIDHASLPIIHIAGTKGKGSTATMTETILRESGYKTGLFTSPHLIDVRERIVMNGKPIDKRTFIRNYWELTAYGSDASFAAGRLDATNVITPLVCGITSIGYDHEAILGHTLTEIANEKSGIMKPGIPVIVQPQLEEAMNAIQRMSIKQKAPLWLSASTTPYKLSMLGEHQHCNAAQALALADYFMKKKPLVGQPQPIKLATMPSAYPVFEPSLSMIKGVTQARYGGRGHIMHMNGHVFFVDGAHTNKSISLATNWFHQMTMKESDSFLKSQSWFFDVPATAPLRMPQLDSEVVEKRICIFNFTKNRSPQTLLQPLLS